MQAHWCKPGFIINKHQQYLFDEVLRPSQINGVSQAWSVNWPSQINGVISSVVSLPGPVKLTGSCQAWSVYRATILLGTSGQAYSYKRLTSIAGILLSETDNCPSWISSRERMTRKYFMIKSPWKNVASPAGIEPATIWSPAGRTSNRATEAGNISNIQGPFSTQPFVLNFISKMKRK